MNTSLSSKQFLALARGEMRVQRPANPFKVERVEVEEQYCLACYGVRKFDVVYAATLLPLPPKAAFRVCRCCGALVGRRLYVGGGR